MQTALILPGRIMFLEEIPETRWLFSLSNYGVSCWSYYNFYYQIMVSKQSVNWLIDWLIDWRLCTAFVSDVSVRQCSTVQSGLSQNRSMKSWLVLEWYLIMFPTPFNEPWTLLHVAPTRCRHNCRCHRQTMSYREMSVVDVRLLSLISMNSICVVIAVECHGACCISCSRLVCYPVLFAC